MAKQKISDAKRKKIYADYINNQNKSETARMNNVSEFAVRDIIKKYQASGEDVTMKIEQKLNENTQNVIESMHEQQEIKKRVLNKLLRNIELKADEENLDKMSIKDLATAYGIILDKELKVLEIQRGNANRDDLMKVEELLTKLEQEANK